MLGQEIFVTVIDVTSKSGTSKAGKPYTLYQVTLSDGNTYKTFKDAVATAAQQLKTQGVPAKAQVHSEKSQGDYPDDLFVDSIEPATNATPAQQTEAATITTNGTTTKVAEAMPPGRTKEDEIRTLSAIRAAVDYVARNGTGDEKKDLEMIGYMAQEFYQLASDGVQGVADKKKELPTW